MACRVNWLGVARLLCLATSGIVSFFVIYFLLGVLK